MEDAIELKGKRIRLTNHLDRKYAKQFAAIANNPEIARNIGAHSFPSPYTDKDAMIFFGLNRKEGRRYFAMDFMIFHEDQVVGIIGLKDINYTDLNSHIGYWIGRDFWNMGFATEALSLMLDFCRDELGLVRLHTGVLDYNLASLRVLMKNGFRVEGFEEKSFRMEDGFHSMFSMARLL